MTNGEWTKESIDKLFGIIGTTQTKVAVTEERVNSIKEIVENQRTDFKDHVEKTNLRFHGLNKKVNKLHVKIAGIGGIMGIVASLIVKLVGV